MRTDGDGRTGTSQSLERGLAILSSFSSGRQLIGVSELSRELGLTRSTTHRYVATLARLGYLHQDVGTRKYSLGRRVLDLGFTAINSMELRHVAAPYLLRLCDETGHTVNMAILDDVDIVYVERFRASRRGQTEIDLDLHIGSRLPAYCTSMGKVLLAFLPDSERDDVLSRTTYARRGPNTLTSKAALLTELRRVRATGIAVNNEELAYGLRSVAVPVIAASGEAVAAVNLAAHRTMASLDDLVARIGPLMQRTAAEISAQLGYRSARPGVADVIRGTAATQVSRGGAREPG
jgi:IclR family transcriptional regulator, pca regulon regulatory protein